jgi:hypothetical protein
LLRYGSRLTTVAQIFFYTTAVERLELLERGGRLKKVQMPRFGGTLPDSLKDLTVHFTQTLTRAVSQCSLPISVSSVVTIEFMFL